MRRLSLVRIRRREDARGTPRVNLQARWALWRAFFWRTMALAAMRSLEMPRLAYELRDGNLTSCVTVGDAYVTPGG